jgi:hypothetical protein
MSTTSQDFITLLSEELSKINLAISALQADHVEAASALPKRRGRPPGIKVESESATDVNVPDWVLPAKKKAPAQKKRTLSAEGRKRIIEATKARWARINAEKAAAAAPKKTAPAKKAVSKNSAVLAAVTPPVEDTEFKAKMSAAMKKAWRKRKKAAKKAA